MKTFLRIVLAVTLPLGLSCKFQLTPESLSQVYDDIKNANEELTPDNEYYVGRAVATTLLARNDYKYLDADGYKSGQLKGLTAYVNHVGSIVALASIAGDRENDRPMPIAGWHFVVLDNATINAFAAPGGFIFVTAGAVRAARNEDELAAILAHEVAHVVRGHALGSIEKSRWAGVGKRFLDNTVELDEAALGKLTESFEGAMDDMVDALLVKGYSRDTEFEADEVGMSIMAMAGYDTRAFVAYLDTLRSKQGTGNGGFFATHPRAEDRIARLQKRVKGANPQIAAVRVERFRDQTSMLQ